MVLMPEVRLGVPHQCSSDRKRIETRMAKPVVWHLSVAVPGATAALLQCFASSL